MGVLTIIIQEIIEHKIFYIVYDFNFIEKSQKKIISSM